MRELIFKQQPLRAVFTYNSLCHCKHIVYYPLFRKAIHDLKVNYSRVTHQSAAINQANWHPPCGFNLSPWNIARLACLIHAASVHSEPGSNSPKKIRNVCIKALWFFYFVFPRNWPRINLTGFILGLVPFSGDFTTKNALAFTWLAWLFNYQKSIHPA